MLPEICLAPTFRENRGLHRHTDHLTALLNSQFCEFESQICHEPDTDDTPCQFPAHEPAAIDGATSASA
jgi:hypothetical protein